MDGTRTTCLQPTSSVLFDGCIPTLTGLDCNMWASQLLTLQTTRSLTTVIFDFTDTPGYDRVERVELVMFNCPQWGTGTNIHLTGATARDQFFNVFTSTSVSSITSCESLVRVCLSANVSLPLIGLRFDLDQDSNWVHLAEVNLYARGSTCPPNIILTPPPSMTTMTTPPGTPCSYIDCLIIHAKRFHMVGHSFYSKHRHEIMQLHDKSYEVHGALQALLHAFAKYCHKQCTMHR